MKRLINSFDPLPAETGEQFCCQALSVFLPFPSARPVLSLHTPLKMLIENFFPSIFFFSSRKPQPSRRDPDTFSPLKFCGMLRPRSSQQAGVEWLSFLFAWTAYQSHCFFFFFFPFPLQFP